MKNRKESTQWFLGFFLLRLETMGCHFYADHSMLGTVRKMVAEPHEE